MNIDRYLDRQYHKSKYNCAHFVCDVWKDITGQDISISLQAVLTGPGARKLHTQALKAFEAVAVPLPLALVLFQAGRNAPHVGIWLDGRVLHITDKGVSCVRLESLEGSFNKMRFYNVKKGYDCGKCIRT